MAHPELDSPSHKSNHEINPAPSDMDEMIKLRKSCKYFRVLIIGRANAGKTTILQKLCNTDEAAKIQNPKGKIIPLSTIFPSAMRGMHDIEKELVFPSNPGFIFHDSRGIESGGSEELDIVKKFVTKRAKAKKLQDRIHVIWYCIPVDNDRMFTAAEQSFFDGTASDELGGNRTAKDNLDDITAKAPVIAIFTKFDHRDISAFMALQQEGMDFPEAKEKAADRAKVDFEKDYLPLIYERKYPPKKHVYLRDMDKPDASISELTESTAEVLDIGALKLMFVSTQKSNIALCAKFAIAETILKWYAECRQGDPTMPYLDPSDLRQFGFHLLSWFPDDLNNLPKKDSQVRTRRTKHEEINKYGLGLAAQMMSVEEEILQELTGAIPEAWRLCRLGVALCIIAEHSYLFPPQHSLGEAIKAYITSPSLRLVHKNVNDVLNNQTSDSELGDALFKMIVNYSLSANTQGPKS